MDEAIQNNMWLKLAAFEVGNFEAHPEAYLECLVTCTDQRVIMSMAYGEMVKFKLVAPLEKIDAEEKKHLWAHAKEVSKDRCEPWKLLEICQALYAIKCFQTK